ncbi:MAG: hypothetical protein DI639_07545 [Leifsonia xyli]|nr:MAG: hypothetical protein DI639_07545 [Leifsonia xyli]
MRVPPHAVQTLAVGLQDRSEGALRRRDRVADDRGVVQRSRGEGLVPLAGGDEIRAARRHRAAVVVDPGDLRDRGGGLRRAARAGARRARALRRRRGRRARSCRSALGAARQGESDRQRRRQRRRDPGCRRARWSPHRSPSFVVRTSPRLRT